MKMVTAESDTNVQIWINIHLRLFIMSIKVRQMINKTIWKACNDVNGVRHVVLSCQMMYSGWWFTNCIICTLLTRAKALQQSIWLCLHRVFKFPTSINKILIIFSISTNHSQHITLPGIVVSINSRLTILINTHTHNKHKKVWGDLWMHVFPGIMYSEGPCDERCVYTAFTLFD